MVGVCVMMTGLSGAGKSTLAKSLAARWEAQGRPVTILDGDEARRLISSELGFSPEHRDLNIARLAYVAAEVAKHGGASIVAAIAPHAKSRRAAMAAMRANGVACLVHVCTPLDVCEERDPKGLYAKARAGALEGMTGIGSPYDEPMDADVRVDLSAWDLGSACESIESWIRAATPR